jgi:hypothetical protein
MTDLEHSFDDEDELYTEGKLERESGIEETEALGIDSDHIESENEPTGAPEGMHFDSEEEKQAFLAEVEATLKGEGDDEPVAEFVMGLTPMGTVGVRVTDEQGDSVNYFISDPSEAWEIAGHLQSLATIMAQTRYAMAMQEQRMVEEMMKKQDLYVPGHGKIG